MTRVNLSEVNWDRVLGLAILALSTFVTLAIILALWPD